MDAVKYFKEKARMTKNCSIPLHCFNCPFSKENNGTDLFCIQFELSHFEEAVRIVEKWSKEHPIKTRKMDLLEKLPNVKLTSAGIPCACAMSLGYRESCTADECGECWNTPM